MRPSRVYLLPLAAFALTGCGTVVNLCSAAHLPPDGLYLAPECRPFGGVWNSGGYAYMAAQTGVETASDGVKAIGKGEVGHGLVLLGVDAVGVAPIGLLFLADIPLSLAG